MSARLSSIIPGEWAELMFNLIIQEKEPEFVIGAFVMLDNGTEVLTMVEPEQQHETEKKSALQ